MDYVQLELPLPPPPPPKPKAPEKPPAADDKDTNFEVDYTVYQCY